MIANVLMSTAEQTWWNLTFEDRVHYEKCVHHIVYTHFRGNCHAVRQFIYAAQDAGYTCNALVKAIVWRLFQEIEDVEYNY